MNRIGRYQVVRELRAGGMGSVTLCTSPDGQLVVLKRPHSLDRDAAVRLRDEARIGARLLHPSIVDTLDLFELDTGVPVLVVAYIDGPSLEVLRPVGPLPAVVVARVGRQIAEGLAALHEARDEHDAPLHILHRDVTPGNIVVGKDGDAKLIDLGIARFSERQAEHTQDGFLRGTMRYLAPELLQGETYTAASDLWSLGMVLWEAAVGRFAYRGETDREVLAGILRGEPMELERDEYVDPELITAIRPLLELSPLRRTREASEAAERFAALEAQHQEPATMTRDTVETFLALKADRDAAQKAKLAEMLRPENLGFPSFVRGAVIGDELFPDEATAAEVERLDEGGSAYDLPHTLPQASVDAEAEAEEHTVRVPAPVSFLAGDEDDKGEGARRERELDSHEDELDATTPMPTLVMPAAALPSGDEPRRPTPSSAWPAPVSALSEDDDDDEPTLVSPVAAIPAPAAPIASVATGSPAPELDDDEMEQMHTMDGLVPVKRPSAPATEPPPDDEGQRPSIGRIALARKSAQQIEEERRATPPPPTTRPSIDDLPPARPKRRAKKASGSRSRAASDRREEAEEVEEEPSSIETRFVDEVKLRRELAEQTQVDLAREEALPSSALGARLVELPAPASPLSPRSPSLAQGRADGAHTLATPRAQIVAGDGEEESPKRAAGEVMKLSEVAAFLEDD